MPIRRGERRWRRFSRRITRIRTPPGAEFTASLVVSGLKGLRKSPFGNFSRPRGRPSAADAIGWLNLPEPADPALPSIVLIGDSTVRNGRGDGAGGQWGWGDPLAEHFDATKLNIVNRAIGGLSSRTFRTAGPLGTRPHADASPAIGSSCSSGTTIPRR
jgi:hypothetical protein